VSYSGHARELREVLTALNVPFSESGEGEWVTSRAADSVVVLAPRAVPGDALHRVPNVLGMGLRDALFLLEERGIRVTVRGNGMVKRQSLNPGDPFRPGTTILIELAA
jgi:cell division protein FtsI (penicillin-binding protein 3)